MPHHEENKAKRKKEVSHSSIFTNTSDVLLPAVEKKLRNLGKTSFFFETSRISTMEFFCENS